MTNIKQLNTHTSHVGRMIAAAYSLVLAALATTGPASAVGLVYVEAGDGINGTLNLAPAAGGLLSDALDSTQSVVDDKWGLRTLGVNGNAYESTTTANPGEENSPELKLTLSSVDGLVSGANYDVYVAYWSATGQNWTMKGGLTSGNHTLFNRTPVAFLPTAVTGTPATQAVWTTGPALETEGDRVMLLGKVGTATALGGQIDVFIDDLPTEAFPESTGAGAFTYRSWLDGVAFIEGGLGTTLNATVDQGSGEIKLFNNTGQSLNILGYSITSAAGALDPSPTKWLSISNNSDGDNGSGFSPDIWNVTAPVEPFPAAATALTEVSTGVVGGPLTSAPAGLDLGDAWIRTPIQDLQITVTLANQSTVAIIPTYSGTPIESGDLDGDGNVDVDDYIIFSANLHTNVSTLTRAQAYKLGDLTGNLAINYDDFIAFRTAYNGAHGAGAFEAAFGVPEPAAALLLALGALLGMSVVRRRESTHSVRPILANFILMKTPACLRRTTQMVPLTLRIPSAAIAVLALAGQANAQLVSGWGYETGIVSGTLTEGVPGSFSSTGVAANAGPRALFGPLDFTDVSDIIRLSGTAQFPNGLGNQQFRAGLFNNNGHALGALNTTTRVWEGADPSGWLGYLYQLGGTSGTDRVIGRLGTGTSSWLANGDTYGFGSQASATAAPANTPYNFSLKLTRLGPTSVKTDFTFIGGTVNRSGSFTDNNAGPSASTTSYNAVGFLMNNNTGSGTFSNVSVVAPQELRLRVNTTTGGISVVNAHNVSFSINYYEITSASGALNLANWHSFDDQEGVDPPGAGWVEAGGSTANILSETNLLGSKSVLASTNVNVGNAFNIGGTQDLVFSYGVVGGTTLTSAFVEYVSGGVPGDYNGNNAVDLADYVIWRESVGQPTITNRGPGIVGNVGQADYDFWRSNFGAISASGGGSNSGNVPIPEPATAALAALVFIVLACKSRTHTRQL